jgi:hypothetical protein
MTVDTSAVQTFSDLRRVARRCEMIMMRPGSSPEHLAENDRVLALIVSAEFFGQIHREKLRRIKSNDRYFDGRTVGVFPRA